MKKKKFSFLLFVLTIAVFLNFNLSFVNAGVVPFEVAQQVAEKWMEKVGENREITEGIVLQYDGDEVGYLFNFYEGGYVVIPSDDIFKPVKAWSRRGIFQRPSPVGMDMETFVKDDLRQQRIFLRNTTRTLSTSSDPDPGWEMILYGESFRASAQTSTQIVGPLLLTKWGQSSPYNAYCPLDGEVPSATGCEATAFAQILRFWQWPKVGTGSRCYFDLCADFEHPYDWENMPETISASSPQAEIDAVARLMFDLGVLGDTNYSASGSGGCIMPEDLSLYFGYSDQAELVYEDRDKFFPTIKAQLDKKYPVSFSSNGHAYVADGYRIESGMNQTHFNFGWDGFSDGWYTLEGLDDLWNSLDQEGSLRVALMINIYPDRIFTSLPESPKLTVITEGLEVNCSWNAVVNAEGYTFSYAFFPYNQGDQIHSIDLGTQTSLIAELWSGAAIYVTVQSYNNVGASAYSNIELFQIE